MGNRSRLARSLDRRQMEHEQRTIGHALQAAGDGFPNVQHRPPPPQQIGPGELVGKLVEMGAAPGYKLQKCTVPPMVRLLATCGPIEIPLDFVPEEARRLSAAIALAADEAEGIERDGPAGPLDAAFGTTVVDA